MSVTRKKVTKAGVTIEWVYEVAEPEDIKRVLWRPGGAGNQDLYRRASAVASRVIQTAPERTGALKRSIRVQQARNMAGRFDAGYEVVATARHALYVIKGTRPHPIVGRPLLVFDWPAGGRHPAVFRRVNHPGTRPNSFFTDAVAAAV